jgi:type I restriction enzyme S subunit
MESEWVTFQEIAELIRKSVSPEDMDADTPYIGLEHIEESNLRLVGIGRAKTVTSTKFRFSKGDILFGKLRPYFRKVIRPDFDGVCSTDIWVVRAKHGIDQGYLYYWMASNDFVYFATQGSEGTKMPRAKWEHVGRFQRIGLSEYEQRAIAHILGSLDDKIELNRKMNKTLEAIARAIFKSWFIDFDPVIDNALRAGNPIPDSMAKRAEIRRQILEQNKPSSSSQRAKDWNYRGGFDFSGLGESSIDEIYGLFPDSFQDSELGAIPKGWEVKTIGSEFRLTMGQSPPGNTYNEIGNGLPFFQGRRDFGFRYPSHRVYCIAPQRLSYKGDTLVSVRAPVGDINMAMERCCIGRGVAGIRHMSNSRSYTYYAMHTLRGQFAKFEAEGTVFGAINKKQFEEIRWISPGENLISKFEKIAFAIDEQIEKNTIEDNTLASLRDTLLPKLISGELRIPDAEKFVEEVGV